ncbi:hypothetical protein [Oceanicella sp. SM1341]|uniref:hypothetical protein n=1 Tax=Oceanicella sp. SM1341 TaxID=1548889 RepID=UPI0013008FAF|nr:hypothetical protein [Oceanicella sp. SM1341]
MALTFGWGAPFSCPRAGNAISGMPAMPLFCWGFAGRRKKTSSRCETPLSISGIAVYKPPRHGAVVAELVDAQR